MSPLTGLSSISRSSSTNMPRLTALGKVSRCREWPRGCAGQSSWYGKMRHALCQRTRARAHQRLQRRVPPPKDLHHGLQVANNFPFPPPGARGRTPPCQRWNSRRLTSRCSITTRLCASSTTSASGERRFVFGEDIYYRIYAERQHVGPSEQTSELLARTALQKLYGPSFFWLLRLPPTKVAGIILTIMKNPRSSNVHLICRPALLLGSRATRWLNDRLTQCWKSHPQPPDHYFSCKKMIASVGKADLRLVSLQQSAGSKILLPGENQSIIARQLVEDPREATNLLSRVCMAVFNGDHNLRQSCRQSDVFAYGAELSRMGDLVAEVLLCHD